MENNDWIDENEERAIKRRMWNRMETTIDNPTRTQDLLSKIGATIIVAGLLALFVGFVIWVLGLMFGLWTA